MAGPAAAGVLIFAKDVDRVADFYAQVLGMQTLHRAADIVVLESAALQLVVHGIPAAIACRISIDTPPQRRDNVAVKFFATVASLADTGSLVGGLGGQVFDETWDGPGFRLCNAMDCEGNVFQLRETVARGI